MLKKYLITILLMSAMILMGCGSIEKTVEGCWEECNPEDTEDGITRTIFYDDSTLLFETGEIITYGGEDGSMGAAERVRYSGHYYEENDTIKGYVEEMGEFTVYIFDNEEEMDFVFDAEYDPIVYKLTKQ